MSWQQSTTLRKLPQSPLTIRWYSVQCWWQNSLWRTNQCLQRWLARTLPLLYMSAGPPSRKRVFPLPWIWAGLWLALTNGMQQKWLPVPGLALSPVASAFALLEGSSHAVEKFWLTAKWGRPPAEGGHWEALQPSFLLNEVIWVTLSETTWLRTSHL